MKFFWRWSPVLLLALAAVIFFQSREREAVRSFSPAPPAAEPVPANEVAGTAAVKIPAPETPAVPAAAFNSWSQKFLSATEDEKALLSLDGIPLATARRVALEKLIQTDPRAALEQAVPDDVRKKLPDAIQSLLEERVSGRGFFGTLIADSPEQNRREIKHEVVLNGRRFNAYVYGQRFSQTTHEKDNLWGIAIGSSLAVHEEPIRTLTKSEAIGLDAKENCPVSGQPADTHRTPVFGQLAGRTEAYCGAGHLAARNQRLAADGGIGGDGTEPPIARDGWTQGPRSILFMRVAYPDDATEAITEAGASALMDSVSSWFAETSYNSTWLVTDVTPLLTLPQPRAWYCENGDYVLLADAREVARNAGFDTDNYNLDIVRFASPGSGCNGFGYSGQAYVGGKGCWMLSSGAGVQIHELGHNYGVWHANFWTGLGEGVISHGSHVEYGNPYDVMGSSGGQGQFNAAFKNILDWLPDAQVQTVSTSGTYRVFTYDVAALTPGQNYALKIRKDYDRNYWAEFRRKIPNAWFLNGVMLNWDAWNNGVANSASGTHLLDTTPGTPAGNSGKDDGAVIVGRTYADEASGIYLTPVARGDGSLPENWIDVVVNLGPFAGNRPPSLTLIPDRINVAVSGTVNFTAVAEDADGDALAYAWDFGDQSFGPNSASVARAWASAGHYVVRCTASDMKGGVATKTVTITVGTPTTFRASGRITLAGQPLEGVRVSNNQSGSSYRGAYTDSDGYYTVAGLAVGAHTLTAVKYGYTLPASGWINPINVGPDAASLNFDAAALPQIGFTLIDTNLGEAGLNPAVVRLTRGGNTSSALTVRLNRTGSAFNNSDYTMTPAPTSSPLQYVLAAGVTNLDIIITPLPDITTEGPEFITLTLIEDANYVLVSRAEVTLTLVDDEAAVNPTVSISAYSGSGLGADNLATESGNDAGVFIVTRSGSIANELLVPYTVLGSATAGVDYVALPGVVSIPAGQTTALITLNTLDDAEVETNETVIVRLLTSAAYTLSTASNATVTIQDDDPVMVTVVATDNLATETIGNIGIVTFNRLGSLAANLVVNYTLAGSAVNGSDYTTLSGSVTIAAGRPNFSMAIIPINDATTEGDETIIVQVQSSAAYNVGHPGSATVVIQDNEIPTVSFSAFDASASEGGSNPGAFRFSRSGAATDALEVFYTLGGEAVSGADYDALPGSFRFAPGVTLLDVAVNPIDDSIIESAERVLLSVLPNPNYVIGTAGLLTVTITDNDTSSAAIGFDAAASQGSESDFSAQISLRLSASRTASASVNYTVTGGSATGGGTDYTLAAGTLVFPAGEVNRTLNFSVVNDTLAEGDETMVITLSNPTNAVLDALSTHTYTIVDDDVSGALTIAAVDATASESGGDTGTFRITRATAAASPQTVLLQVLGSASAPTDYAPLPSSVVIPAGSSFVDLLVVPVDDATDETNETVTVKLIPSPGGRLGSPSVATVTILDNDDSNLLPIVRVDAPDASASEPGADTGTFRIARDRGTNTALTIQFFVSGTAAGGTDYTNLSSSVTLPVGVWATNLVVFPRNDTTFEADETVVLTLTILASYRVDPRAAAATVTIVDDEQGVGVTGSGVSAENGSSFGTFVLTRTGSTVSNLPVQFTWAGTAALNDFTPNATNVIIPAGTNSITLTIAATSDAVTEGIETLVLTLATNINYRVLTQNTATILLNEGSATPWQQWRALHFTPAELANPAISSADADADGDGRRNLLEYAHHKNPRVADGGGGFTGRMESSTNYVIRFTRRKAPTDLNYLVDLTPDFSSWQSGGAVTQEILPATDDGNGVSETAAFRILPGAASPAQKFVRLKVTLVP